jgi:hypothetical protein
MCDGGASITPSRISRHAACCSACCLLPAGPWLLSGRHVAPGTWCEPKLTARAVLQGQCAQRDRRAAASRELHDLALEMHLARPRFTLTGDAISNKGRRMQLLEMLGRVSAQGLLPA